MNLKEGDVDITKVIIVALVWVADEQFTLRIVVLQSILQGSTYEATSDNSNVYHINFNLREMGDRSMFCLLRCCFGHY